MWVLAPLAATLYAQSSGEIAGAVPLAVQSGEPAPAPSTPVMIRDADGKIVVRATRITRPLKIDGQLDDAPYAEVPSITEFVQQVPKNGVPVSEKTEAWVLFDDDNLYVACRCWDMHPERIVANDLRHDGPNQAQHDSFAVVLDTFHEGRSGYMLYVTAVGARRDSAITDMRSNNDWNPIWDGTARRFENGWIAEMAVPFKSLRYGAGRQQTWGIQLRRLISHKKGVLVSHASQTAVGRSSDTPHGSLRDPDRARGPPCAEP